MRNRLPDGGRAGFGPAGILLCLGAGVVGAALCVAAYAAVYRAPAPETTTLIAAGAAALLAAALCFLGLKVFSARNRAIAHASRLAGELAHETELREKAEKALADNTQEDPITGIASARYFRARAEIAISRARRTRGPISILVMGIDDYPKLAKTLDIDGCNQVLARLGSICRAVTREVDIPARLEDGRFAILLEDTAAEGAKRAIGRLRKEIAQTESWASGRLGELTVGFGAIEINARYHLLEDGLKWASSALDHAQSQGTNRVCFARDYDPAEAEAA